MKTLKIFRSCILGFLAVTVTFSEKYSTIAFAGMILTIPLFYFLLKFIYRNSPRVGGVVTDNYETRYGRDIVIQFEFNNITYDVTKTYDLDNAPIVGTHLPLVIDKQNVHNSEVEINTNKETLMLSVLFLIVLITYILTRCV